LTRPDRADFLSFQKKNTDNTLVPFQTSNPARCRPEIEVGSRSHKRIICEAVADKSLDIVRSFMSNFNNRESQRSPTPTAPIQTRQDSFRYDPPTQDGARNPKTPTGPSQHPYNLSGDSPQQRVERDRVPSRPMSMVQTYQPPLMDVSQDTLPELQPIFTFLNSHGNKLYQEGYFLKLDDQNTRQYFYPIISLPGLT